MQQEQPDRRFAHSPILAPGEEQQPVRRRRMMQTTRSPPPRQVKPALKRRRATGYRPRSPDYTPPPSPVPLEQPGQHPGGPESGTEAMGHEEEEVEVLEQPLDLRTLEARDRVSMPTGFLLWVDALPPTQIRTRYGSEIRVFVPREEDNA